MQYQICSPCLMYSCEIKKGIMLEKTHYLVDYILLIIILSTINLIVIKFAFLESIIFDPEYGIIMETLQTQ